MNDEDLKRWSEASRLGQKKFKMASPCRNGHLGERYVKSNGSCVQCIAAASAKHYKGARVEIHLLDRAHRPLLLEYAQKLNDFTKSSKS